MMVLQMRCTALLVLAFSLVGCAGAPVSEADREIEKIIEVKNTSKDVIYEGAKMWIAETFVSAKAVLEYDNKEAGRLIGNGRMNYPCSGFDCMTKSDWKVNFTMKVDVKDDKIRMTFTNIRLSWPATYSAGVTRPAYNGPVNTQSAMNDIKPALLKLGDGVVDYIGKTESKKDW